MSELEALLNEEEVYRNNFIQYNTNLDDRVINNTLNKWREQYIDEGELSVCDLPNTFILNNEQILALRNLRFGVVNQNVIRRADGVNVYSISESKDRRVEYGGYISPLLTPNISLNFVGDDGAITDYVNDVTKVNFHTHPSIVGKWPFSPPSDDDLYTMISQSLKLKSRIVSLVAASEGIYVYYMGDTLFRKLMSNPVDEDGNIIYTNGFGDTDLFKDLKLSLGYERSVSMKNKRGRRLWGGLTPPKRAASESEPREEREEIDMNITLEQFLATINAMGICMKLYRYDEEVIPLPLSLISDSAADADASAAVDADASAADASAAAAIGGSRFYKINFTNL
jgi:hypothetical protein